ncbi:hypothetical protein ACLB2K_005965 [Fragaria x ananassa]
MSHFSFLGFHYGSSMRKSRNKPAPQLSKVSKERQRSSVSSRSSSQPKMEEIRWVFDKFDTNKDGKISREEYKSLLKTLDKEMTEAEIAKTFKALDSDGDDSIGWTEFVEMFNMGADEAKKADIEGAFRVFDLDGNGKISAEELSLVLKKLGENCSLGACKKMVKRVQPHQEMTVDEFKAWLRRFDNDHNGQISREELTEALHSLKIWFGWWKSRLVMKQADSNRDGQIDNTKEFEKMVNYAQQNLHMKIYQSNGWLSTNHIPHNSSIYFCDQS